MEMIAPGVAAWAVARGATGATTPEVAAPSAISRLATVGPGFSTVEGCKYISPSIEDQ